MRINTEGWQESFEEDGIGFLYVFLQESFSLRISSR